MSRALLLFVRFHEGRYHGEPEWPPSPARLFQALVAGAARGRTLSAGGSRCLRLVGAPRSRRLSPHLRCVPGVASRTMYRTMTSIRSAAIPARISEIRAAKLIRPRLFDAEMPLLYAWKFDEGEEHARKICEIAERLYQLGRGVDMAWAWGEIIDAIDIDARLAGHGGALHRPARSGAGSVLSARNGVARKPRSPLRKAGQRFTAIRSGQKSPAALLAGAEAAVSRRWPTTAHRSGFCSICDR